VTVRLRVLLVEDSEDDALLILRQLARSGYEVEHVRVQTRAQMVDAMERQEWDVILCDYKLPRFNAPDALRSLQEAGLDIPFIVVSGTVGEDVAVSCMRAGAADFLSKFNLRRLGPAVARELQDAAHRKARRRAEVALRRTAENARKIIAASLDGVVVVDTNGVVQFANPTAEMMLGNTNGGLVGRQFDVPIALGRGGEVDLSDRAGRPLVVETGFSDVQWEEESAYLVTLHDVTDRMRSEQQLRDSFVVLADTLSLATASRDPYTTNHQRRVADLVGQVGVRLGLDENELWDLRMGALLHDIGKVAVPEAILTKPGRLSPEETELVRTHVQEGYRILQSTQLPPPVSRMVLHHHELLDGSGYPQGLTEEELSLPDRILALCNIVEAMGSFRPHRTGRSIEEVLAEAQAGAGVRYDIAVAEAVTDILQRGSFVLGG